MAKDERDSIGSLFWNMSDDEIICVCVIAEKQRYQITIDFTLETKSHVDVYKERQWVLSGREHDHWTIENA